MQNNNILLFNRYSFVLSRVSLRLLFVICSSFSSLFLAKSNVGTITESDSTNVIGEIIISGSVKIVGLGNTNIKKVVVINKEPSSSNKNLHLNKEAKKQYVKKSFKKQKADNRVKLVKKSAFTYKPSESEDYFSIPSYKLGISILPQNNQQNIIPNTIGFYVENYTFYKDRIIAYHYFYYQNFSNSRISIRPPPFLA